MFSNSIKLILHYTFFLVFSVSCTAQPQQEENEYYKYKNPSRDGIGKIYMGREIAHVMGHQGASWLERNNREKEERTDLAVQMLPITPNAVVADIGAGTGYYSFRISQIASDGKVLAVDIQQEMLDMIAEKQKKLGVNNIERILGTEKNPNLPQNAVDLVLFVDVYHELAYPFEVMQHIVKALKVNGKVVLLEYRAEDPNVPIKKLHKMSASQVRKEMKAVGLQFVENKSQLPWQHFMIFQKKQ
ncbi:MAG: methyltransferase domain-containing protein [Bacteroidota bacterium]